VREARRPKSAAELRREGELKAFFSKYDPSAGQAADARTE
jgi:hypothetical protein